MKTGGFRDQILTKTHAAISLKIFSFESSFPKVYFKFGPRVHRPPRFWATDRRKFAWHFAYRKYTFWQSCLLRKESHTTLILYFDWLKFYARNEAADIFFVIKPKTGRISLFKRWLVPLVQFSKKKNMKRYPTFSVQIIYYQIDLMHKWNI